MYHQVLLAARKFLVISSIGALILSTQAGAQAQRSLAVLPSSAPPVEYPANDYPILLPGTKIKTKPAGVELFQVDREALGDRKPLLLVHGLKGESWPQFRWNKLIKRFKDYPDFNRNYKIYLARYNTAALLSETTPHFQQALLDLQRACGGKQLTVMALSLGGSLVQAAMQDRAAGAAIKLAFTLGAPLHGSPLFSSDWLQWSIYKNFYQPWTRIDHSLAYRIYFKINANLVHDLAWDNCDGYLPDAGKFKSKLPLGPKGELSVSADANRPLLARAQDPAIDKSKFIVYAAYMTNPYLSPGLKQEIESAILSPLAWLTWKVPSHLAREHPVLKMLNRDISRVLGAAPDTSHKKFWPYLLNDGITPVASALYLPAEACRKHPLKSESAISGLAAYTDVRLARLFKNADHLTFIDSVRPRPFRIFKMLQDELNPRDGQRTMFDWILSDLMQFESVPSQVARESSRAETVK